MKILKLGGSIITYKDQYLKVNFDNVSRISKELSQVEDQFILVHGAGSFGHFKALEFGLDNEVEVFNRQNQISRVMRDVEYLNSIVLDELINNDIPAVGLPPHSMLSPYVNIDIVENLIISGFIPVLYGDGFVWRGKHRIISGDEIIEKLVEYIPVDAVIFATDVDGIYTMDPKVNPDAKLIEHIKGKNYSVKFESHDATGSMGGKMASINAISEYVNKIIIINGNVPNRIRDAMNDKDVKGTVIER